MPNLANPPLWRFETAPTASLNRLQIVDLPGLPLDESVRGRRGDELLSNRALLLYVGEHAEALDLSPGDFARVRLNLLESQAVVRNRVARTVNEALLSHEPRRRAAAEAVAVRLGRNLGWLLIALHRGDAVNRAGRPDWRDADWECWRAVRQVFLGGGLSSGRLGELLVTQATELIREHGYAQAVQVKLSPHRERIALVGVSRTLSMDGAGLRGTRRAVLGFDFGHTLVKRAILRYDDGRLTNIESMTPHLVEWRELYDESQGKQEFGRNVLSFLARIIADTAAEAPAVEPLALVSIASHIRHGKLIESDSYAAIHAVSDVEVDALVSAAASRHAGRQLATRLVHDGTAAALAHAGARRSATLVLGTALGLGFPPEQEAGLCEVDIK